MLQGHHSAQRPAEAPLFAFTHPVKGLRRCRCAQY